NVLWPLRPSGGSLPFLVYIHPSDLVTIDWPRPFNSFCAEDDKDSSKMPYDLETLKEFVQEVGSIGGMEGDDGLSYEESTEQVSPSLGSVQQILVLTRSFACPFY